MTSKLEKPKPHQVLPKPNIKRKRGGQPGNSNALKHGFYSRRFSKLELKDLDIILNHHKFEDEIALLHVISRRMFNIADKEADSIEDWATVNFAIGSTVTRIGGLKKVQFMISGGKTGNELTTEMVLTAIHNNQKRMGLS